jgi:hypothetical protein
LIARTLPQLRIGTIASSVISFQHTIITGHGKLGQKLLVNGVPGVLALLMWKKLTPIAVTTSSKYKCDAPNPMNILHFKKITLLLLLTGVVSCEIDDDFGTSTFSEKRGELLLTNQFNVFTLLWANSNTILLQEYSAIRKLNIQTKATSVLIAGSIEKLVGVTSNNKAIVITSSYDFERNVYSLIAVDIATNESVTLAADIVFDYNAYQYNTTISGNNIVYAEISTDPWAYYGDVYFHNLETDEREFVAAESFPLALSPNSSQILIQSLSGFQNFYSIYNRQSESFEPLNLSSFYPLKLRWNENGILSFTEMWTDQGSWLRIINESNPSQTLIKNCNIPPSALLITTPDGSKFLYGSVRCSIPAYTTYCYDNPALVSLKVGSFPSGEEKLAVAYKQFQGEDTPIFQSADFSPDNQNIVYLKQGNVYISQNF